MRTRSTLWSGPPGDIRLNVTPMVDCAFQLLLFFILAGQMTTQHLIPLDLPHPHDSQAAHLASRTKSVIINVISAQGQPGAEISYEVEGLTLSPDQMPRVTELIRARLAAAGDAAPIEVRADRRVGYGQVYPLLSAISAAGATQVSVTAIVQGVSNDSAKPY